VVELIRGSLASCSISGGIYGKKGTGGYLTRRKTPYPVYLVFFRRTLPFILEQCSQELADVCVGGPDVLKTVFALHFLPEDLFLLCTGGVWRPV
jgi:hypothetical protein